MVQVQEGHITGERPTGEHGGVPPALPFFPALEGLRGVAVIGVLIFHGGFAVASGGFLGVSTFFTLSGFLITSLLLREHGATGSVDLRSFWGHRFRRLLPAALATLVLVVTFAAIAADALQRQRLALDVSAALAYVANWRFVLSGQAYGDLFGAPSPVLHFWSLAIEEQFYVLYPLLAYGVLRRLGWSRRAFAAVLGTLLALSVGLSLFAGFSTDRIYYGTDTRAAELLVGALLALAISGERLQRFARGSVRGAKWLAGAGAAGFVLMVLTWATTAHGDAWLYRGGFVAYACLSALVLSASLLPAGPLVSLLAWAPVRYMGRISYGVYLYHWPIFLWLDETNTGFRGVPLFGYQVVVTIAVASLSHRFLEMPVREGRPLFPRQAVPIGRAALGVAGAVVLGGLVLTVTAPRLANDFAAAQQQLQEVNARAAVPASPSSTVPTTAVAAPPPASADGAGAVPAPEPAGAGTRLPSRPRTAIFGDSMMLTTGLGLGDVFTDLGIAEPVGGHTELGCGIGRGGERRSNGGVEAVPPRCDQWPELWGDAMRRLEPHIAIVQEGPWDATERKLPGDDTWRGPGDPVYDRFLRAEMDHVVETLQRNGARRIVWLTSPPIGENVRTSGQPEFDQLDHPERIVRFNELLHETAAAHPGLVTVVDLGGWLAATGEDDRLRPDGVHLGDAESREVARRWLAREVIAAARRS